MPLRQSTHWISVTRLSPTGNQSSARFHRTVFIIDHLDPIEWSTRFTECPVHWFSTEVTCTFQLKRKNGEEEIIEATSSNVHQRYVECPLPLIENANNLAVQVTVTMMNREFASRASILLLSRHPYPHLLRHDGSEHLRDDM